ncbi:MAG: hypothetical protein P9L97_05815 [Candidatus Tenebribacter davisii]|nr:hypothetical protein [Candidatus Tenebribacter davisii]
MTKEEIIQQCKDFAEKNYNKGYDSIVECSDSSDWEDLYADNGGSLPKMMKSMKESADVWIEQNLNARWGEDSDPELTMFD